jgi:hypothetical protein
MNDRIKKLWSQAGGHYDSGNQHTWPQYTIDNPEKFAELIVKECMRMCDCADSSYLEHGCDLEASGAAGAKEIIKEWFEVEE